MHSGDQSPGRERFSQAASHAGFGGEGKIIQNGIHRVAEDETRNRKGPDRRSSTATPITGGHQTVSVVTSIAYYRSNTLFKSAHLATIKITYVMTASVELPNLRGSFLRVVRMTAASSRRNELCKTLFRSKNGLIVSMNPIETLS